MKLLKSAVTVIVAFVLFFGGLALGYGIATGFRYGKLIHAITMEMDNPTDDADKPEIPDDSTDAPADETDDGETSDEAETENDKNPTDKLSQEGA